VFEEGEQNSKVLSFQFQLADSQSRGFCRNFSFVVVHRDVIRWTVSIRNFFEKMRDVRAIACLGSILIPFFFFFFFLQEMKAKADSLFENEQRVETSNGSHFALRRVPKVGEESVTETCF
jgi:hypothetical protein